VNADVDLFEFSKIFPDEESCIAFLERSRWKSGLPVSPFDGGEAYRVGARIGLYKCKGTRQYFSVRHGTIFEESRLPLRKWFLAIFVLHSLRNVISSVQLARYLGVTQKTGWLMLQRIRYAVESESFQKPLHGLGELDRTDLVSKRPIRRARAACGNTSVAASDRTSMLPSRR
jgi:hypothetical protein